MDKPKQNPQRMEVFRLSLMPKQRKLLDKEARRSGESLAAIIRQAINRHLENLEWDRQMERDIESGKMKKLTPASWRGGKRIFPREGAE